MSVIYSFMDNSLYGADEINQTFSKLTTEGVSLFNYTDGDNPLVSLNDAVAGFIQPGIELYNVDACKVKYDKENDKFTIGTGNAFMIDGSSITIDSQDYDITQRVYELRKLNEGDIWVSFYRNIPENCIDIIVDTDDTYFNSEYSVPLAKISADNSVFDKRIYAKTKLAPCSANVINTVTVSCGQLISTDTGDMLKRAVIKEVFPGATKVYVAFNLHDIQRVESGEELVYKRAWPDRYGETHYVAFNMTDEGLEIWMKVFTGSTKADNWTYTIF